MAEKKDSPKFPDLADPLEAFNKVIETINSVAEGINSFADNVDRNLGVAPKTHGVKESTLFRQALAEAQREVAKRGGKPLSDKEREEVKEKIKRKLGVE